MPVLSSRQNSPMTLFVSSPVLRPFNPKPQTKLYSTSTSPLLRHHRFASNARCRHLPRASITMPSQKVRIYTKEDNTPIEKLASSLASAFENDPLLLYFYGSTNPGMVPKHKSLLQSVLSLELSRPEGQTTIHVSEDDSTIALWHHVNHWKVPLFMQLMFPFILFRTFGWSACIRFLKTVDHIERYHPTEPHMHLFIIGTDTKMQGKGTGSTVISKMLQYCDSLGIPAYLESSSERNLPFYIRHGFEVTKKIPNMPQDSPPVFAMWREPKRVHDDLQN